MDETQTFLQMFGFSGQAITILLAVISAITYVNGYLARRQDRKKTDAAEIQESIPKFLELQESMRAAFLEGDRNKMNNVENKLFRLARRIGDMAFHFMETDRSNPRYLSGADYATVATTISHIRDPRAYDLFEHSIKIAHTNFNKMINSRLYANALYTNGDLQSARKMTAVSLEYLEEMKREMEVAAQEERKPVTLMGINVEEANPFGPFYLVGFRIWPPVKQTQKNLFITPDFIETQAAMAHILIAMGEANAGAPQEMYAHNLAKAALEAAKVSSVHLRVEVNNQLSGALEPLIGDQQALAIYRATMASLGDPTRYPLAFCMTDSLEKCAQAPDPVVAETYIAEVSQKILQAIQQVNGAPAEAPQEGAAESGQGEAEGEMKPE